MVRKISSMVGAVAVAVVLVGGIASAAMSPAQAVRHLASYINRGQVDAAAALFADDAVMIGCGGPGNTCHGKAEIVAKDLQPGIDAHTHVRIGDLTNYIDEETGTFWLRDDNTEAAGVKQITGDFSADFNDAGLISRFVVTLNLDDPDTAKFLAMNSASSPSKLPKTGDGSLATQSSRATLPVAGAAGVALLSLAGVALRKRTSS